MGMADKLSWRWC